MSTPRIYTVLPFEDLKVGTKFIYESYGLRCLALKIEPVKTVGTAINSDPHNMRIIKLLPNPSRDVKNSGKKIGETYHCADRVKVEALEFPVTGPYEKK